MAAPWFSGVRAPVEWQRRLAGAGLIAIGVFGVAIAGWAYYDAWSTREAWNRSPEAAALAQQVVEPTPIWVPATGFGSQDSGYGEIAPLPASMQTPVPLNLESRIPNPSVTPTPVVTATADQISLDATDFRFLDPPEPGAHARVAISVTNHADVSSGRVLLGIDASWFDKYSIIGTGPAVSQDRTDDNGLRTFSFPPVPPSQTVNYELHVKAIDEGTLAPAIRVLLESGDVIGSSEKPRVFAPSPRPGPVMAIDIPRLKIHSSVVQTAWEPPPFNVGQIKGSANVTLGNTVLIGHLTGAAGNVFAHLDELKPGDEITATSRGLPYSFVVSQVFEGPNNDAGPMLPEDDPRLTLMTCAGVWNPFTHDYSNRLWVVAEPPEQAAVTIANAEATATVVSEATATAVALLPTETPVPVPTPYKGEPSLPGGIGNSRVSLEKTYGPATGETSGKLVVFRSTGREVHVRFSPEPPRAQTVAITFNPPLTFDNAVRESRKLFPSDTTPRANAPEGNNTLVVERFTSASLGAALDQPDFSVLYTKDPKGAITSLILGVGDDIDALLSDSRR